MPRQPADPLRPARPKRRATKTTVTRKSSTVADLPVAAKVSTTRPKLSHPRSKATARSANSSREALQKQAVAERIVKKIFAEAGKSPKRTAHTSSLVGVTSGSKSTAKTTPNQILAAPSSGETSSPSAAATTTTVCVPSNANARLISKAAALHRWYKERFPHHVGYISTVVGIIFIGIGGLSLIPFVNAMYPDWKSFQSALVCETISCTQDPVSSDAPTSLTTQSNTQDATPGTAVVPAQIPPPALTFLTNPPAVVESPVTVIVRAENVQEVTVVVESRDTDQRFPLRREGPSVGSDHTFAISPAELPVGEYDVRVRAVALRDSKVIFSTGSRFTIPSKTRSLQTSSSAERALTPETSDQMGRSDPITSSPTTSESLGTTTSLNEQPPLIDPISPIAPVLSYTRPTSSVLAIRVQAANALGVEVYAQRLNATAPVLLGMARRVADDRWVYSYDTRSLPDGSYVLVARVTRSQGTIDSPRVPLLVDNVAMRAVSDEATSTVTDTGAVVQTRETIERLAANNEPLPNRSSYVATLPSPPPPANPQPVITPLAVPSSPGRQPVPVVAPLPIVAVPEPLRPVVREQFTEHADALNDLFKRYASAVQTNDASLRTLIEAELNAKRTRLVTATVEAGTEGVTASDLDQSLQAEFNRLKERVETFESLLRERSEQNSAIDRDADGISDHDEVTLYDTDPTLFDTDGDGTSDGAEIMRGFDPLRSAEEAILSYTSPKEFGITRDDVLVVTAITPIIETDRERGTPPVQAEIRGSGIPNSFVTLFIFSSPIVVTVRTAADGSFVYKFDKELEDGTHEVYVAVTDNTGDIVAKSSPFSFVKEAEAFTVIDAATAAPVASSDPAATVSIDQLYHVITALVVLAFGLVLLIFGLVMRRSPVVAHVKDNGELAV